MTQFKVFRNITKKLLHCFFVLLFVFLNIKNSNAIYEGVRSNNYDEARKMCDTGDIKFDPFSENKDLQWDLSNEVCASFVASAGATILASQLLAYFVACVPKNNQGVLFKLPHEEAAKKIALPSPMIDLKTIAVTALIGEMCASRLQEYATYQAASASCAPPYATTPTCADSVVGIIPNVGVALTDSILCCGSQAAYLGVLATGLGVMGGLHGVSNKTYNIARVCGHDWKEWRKDESGMWVKGRGDYRNCVSHLFLGDGTASSCSGVGNEASHFERKITNKFYREFIYGGKEFNDNGEGACDNPWPKAKRIEILGYDGDKQRYYMTGSAEAPVFACQRFLSNEVTKETQKAFECCKKRSQNIMCIETKSGLPEKLGQTSGGTLGDYEHKFCELGQKCKVVDVFFDIYESAVQTDYLCAKTQSVCPYNHNLGGGTEIKKYSTKENAPIIVENFCQFMNHCSKRPIMPFVHNSTLNGHFISSSCRNLKGDSQNSYSYNLNITSTKLDGFTAPIAQCFKETIENVFLNKAGHSECLDSSESPDKNGNCVTGYKFQKGKTLETDSFFVTIQKSLQSAIRMALIFSVVIIGYSIFMAVPKEQITKKKLTTFILKIGIVIYFATGSGWQDNFINNIFSISTTLSDMTFNPDYDAPKDKLDGCQFPKFNYEDNNPDTRHLNPKYAPQNQYLKIWDTLDCKITRALGYGADVSVPNLIVMMVAGFFVGGLGVMFFLATFFFAFMILSIAVRALHIFLISTTAIILLIYISPITITAMLFEKTKNIFTNWWKQLLGFILQPMILFLYIGILINLLDVTVSGDVKFKGDGISAPKQIICEEETKDTSLYCIFNVANLDSFPGLEIIGIGTPLLTNMNKSRLLSIIKAAFIVFVYMQFMDKISEFAKKLVGGGDLSSDWGVSGVASKAASVTQGAVERGRRGLAKGVGSIVDRAQSRVSDGPRKVEKIKERATSDIASGLKNNKGKDIAGSEGGKKK